MGQRSAVIARGMAALFFMGSCCPSAFAVERLYQQRSYLGADVSMTICHDPGERDKAVDALEAAWQGFARAQQRMNVFDPESDVARINAASGAVVSVHEDVDALIRRSVDYARITGGVFDISVRPLVSLWKEAGSQGRLPSAPEIARAKALVDARRIQFLGHGRVKIPSGMTIDLGGVAAGFVADAAAVVLREKGFGDFLIDAGGEILAAGNSCEGRPWRVGVRSPGARDHVVDVIELNDEAVSTSGSYEKYVQVNGERWSHIINPLTGYPARGVVSATVIAPYAADADVLSTALCVLGPGPGGRLIEGLGEGYAAMLLTDSAAGGLEEKLIRDYAVHRVTTGN